MQRESRSTNKGAAAGFYADMRKIGGLLVFIMYMVHLNAFAHYSTSITLRRRSVTRVKAARRLLARSCIFFSESRMYEELLKIYLGFWRGRGARPACLRRYNVDTKDYQIRPFYVNQVLHAVATQRAMHSGESLSRMVDFAIRHYLLRLLESLLSSSRLISEEKQKAWADQYRLRHRRDLYFITYRSETTSNRGATLRWNQNSQLVPKKALSPPEIFHYLRFAA